MFKVVWNFSVSASVWHKAAMGPFKGWDCLLDVNHWLIKLSHVSCFFLLSLFLKLLIWCVFLSGLKQQRLVHSADIHTPMQQFVSRLSRLKTNVSERTLLLSSEIRWEGAEMSQRCEIKQTSAENREHEGDCPTSWTSNRFWFLPELQWSFSCSHTWSYKQQSFIMFHFGIFKVY